MPTPDFWIAIGALFAGTALALYMVMRRPREHEQAFTRAITMPAIQDNLYDAGDEMANDDIVYARDILPKQERKDPELVQRLRELAWELAKKRPGGITSTDVVEALFEADPAMSVRLQKVDKRVTGAMFAGAAWKHTGEWRTTGSHGRPQRVWVLKEGAL